MIMLLDHAFFKNKNSGLFNITEEFNGYTMLKIGIGFDEYQSKNIQVLYLIDLYKDAEKLISGCRLLYDRESNNIGFKFPANTNNSIINGFYKEGYQEMLNRCYTEYFNIFDSIIEEYKEIINKPELISEIVNKYNHLATAIIQNNPSIGKTKLF